jgi:hypothetical protein
VDLGFLPKIEKLPGDRKCWRWQARVGAGVSGQLEVLGAAMQADAVAEYRETLISQGHVQDAAVTVEAEVSVREIGGGVFELTVTAPAFPSDWDMACVFCVMRSFDRRVGPVLEIQGRERSKCPPWFLDGSKTVVSG